MTGDGITSDPAGDFRRIAADFTARVDAVGSSGWTAAAPCEGWTARDVVAHLMGWVPSVLAGAGVELPTLADDDDPAAAWHRFVAAIESVLADPAVADTEFDVGPPGRMTVGQAVDRLVTPDVLVHTWDLARATGQDETIDAELSARVLAGLQPIEPLLRSSGHFGPAVEVADDADVQTRLIAFTGRQP